MVKTLDLMMLDWQDAQNSKDAYGDCVVPPKK